jgi:2TM family of unknown function (DUF5676)
MKPLPTGLALSATVVLFYSPCALVEVAWPDQFMRFMTALFHGLDFRKLVTIATCNWSSFLYALAILAVWAFAAGASFARARIALSSLQGRHVMRYE